MWEELGFLFNCGRGRKGGEGGKGKREFYTMSIEVKLGKFYSLEINAHFIQDFEFNCLKLCKMVSGGFKWPLF